MTKYVVVLFIIGMFFGVGTYFLLGDTMEELTKAIGWFSAGILLGVVSALAITYEVLMAKYTR
jgi:hypothetical protein